MQQSKECPEIQADEASAVKVRLYALSVGGRLQVAQRSNSWGP